MVCFLKSMVKQSYCAALHSKKSSLKNLFFQRSGIQRSLCFCPVCSEVSTETKLSKHYNYNAMLRCDKFSKR